MATLTPNEGTKEGVDEIPLSTYAFMSAYTGIRLRMQCVEQSTQDQSIWPYWRSPHRVVNYLLMSRVIVRTHRSRGNEETARETSNRETDKLC
jgi:hypothetical protein